MEIDLNAPSLISKSKQEEESVTMRITIEGRVQKVGFRSWMQQQAHQHNLDGWVRNKSNGSVEALLCGKNEDIEEVIRQSYNGPPFASVKRVKRFPESILTFKGKGFSILPTV